MISPDTISQILSTARIEEVVGDFVALKRRGVNYLGLCPFHNEKTPSFTVSPSKGIFKCFGCGKAGNAVGFLMEHEHYTYPEALRHLAKRYRIEIEEEEQTPEKVQEQQEKEALFLLNQFALRYFENNLHETEEGKAVGMTYLLERGIREDIIKKFMLGYAPKKWDDFSKHATGEGYKAEYLVKTGLSIQKEDGLSDRFHGRVIFPILSASGRVIGFGGRVLGSEKNTAKYLNSPESEIYNKSKSLYGIYLAKNAIISKDLCYLVEGYTDVISMHQAGIENVVASSGTSLTVDQVKLIRRYTPNITILYDGDPAGIKASLRGIDMILEQGMHVKIVLFPEGEDPDSFARKNRGADVELFVQKNAVNFILFKTRLLLEETAGDPIKKAALIKEIVSTIALIPDGISRSIYIKECSSMMTVPEQTLMNELNKILRQNWSKKQKEEGGRDVSLPEEPAESAPAQIEFDINSSEYQEREIVRLLLQYGNEKLQFKKENESGELEEITVRVAEFIIRDLEQDEIALDKPVFQKIFTEMAEVLQSGIVADKVYFLHHADPAVSTAAIDLSLVPYELSPNWEKNYIQVELEALRLKDSIVSALLTFKARKIEQMIAENQRQLKEARGEEEINTLLETQIRLKNTSRMINSELGRIVIK